MGGIEEEDEPKNKNREGDYAHLVHEKEKIYVKETVNYVQYSKM
jgi:hypothetical protein